MAASPDFDEEARAIFKKLNLLKDGGELIGDVEKERLRYVQGEGKKISMQIYIYIYIYIRRFRKVAHVRFGFA